MRNKALQFIGTFILALVFLTAPTLVASGASLQDCTTSGQTTCTGG